MTTVTTERRRDRRRRERDLRKRQPAPTRSRWTGLPALSAIAVVGGAIVIALAILVAGRPGAASPPASVAPVVAGFFRDLPTEGFTIGQADAPVTIDLYEDFQCPACKRWGDTVFPILAANELTNGQARIVFHDFAFLGPESFHAARAGHAAANQGKFWEMWAAIYASQGPENSGALGPTRLAEIARSIGLDVDRFTEDMSLGAAGPAVDASNEQARQLGVNSTPSVAINGELVVGGGYDEISAAIAAAANATD
jgi:protein-disulfide isomerase